MVKGSRSLCRNLSAFEGVGREETRNGGLEIARDAGKDAVCRALVGARGHGHDVATRCGVVKGGRSLCRNLSAFEGVGREETRNGGLEIARDAGKDPCTCARRYLKSYGHSFARPLVAFESVD